MFLGVFLYSIGFIGDLIVPKSLDSPARVSPLAAVMINVLLLSVFAVQHSVMARPAFKRWWAGIVPKPIERSTYVLFSNIAMILIFVFWQPLGGQVWHLENNVARGVMLGLYAAGWLTVFTATCLLNHFELFGMRQVTLYLLGRPYTELPFKEPALYGYVRHPLYVGWLMVFWLAPTMTISRLMFAMVTTAYILVAVRLEERDLEAALPGYAEYKRRVPMLIPNFLGTADSTTGTKAKAVEA
jgi:protein-S-isoprenylcysteine O-methyltransferase Ste14